jgi:hypothetical protein
LRIAYHDAVDLWIREGGTDAVKIDRLRVKPGFVGPFKKGTPPIKPPSMIIPEDRFRRFGSDQRRRCPV